MPEGRMIKRKIVDSYRLNNVPVEARLLYLEMITHLDCEGRLQADPRWVNKRFFSYDDFSPEQVDGWLNDLWKQKKKGKGLIQRYEIEEHQYLWMPGFWGEQSVSWQKYTYPIETQSTILAPLEKDDDLEKKLTYLKNYKEKHPDKAELIDAKLSKMKHIEVKQSEPSKDIVDDRVAQNIKLYEDLNARPATPNELEHIKDDTANYPKGWFEQAVAETKKYGKRSLRYIETILERWHKEGRSPSEETKVGTHKGHHKPTTTSLKDRLGESLTD